MAFQNAKRRSRQKANGGRGFTRIHWNTLVRIAKGVCAYCRAARVSSIDHFVPLALGGLNDYTNIVPACRRCNSRKGSLDPVMWIRKTFGPYRLIAVRKLMLKD